jgi:glutamate transport system permease protein
MDVVFSHLSRYADGMELTLRLTLISYVGAFVIGLTVASFRVSPVPPLRLVGSLYVNVFRNTPLAVQMILFVFGLTQVGIKYPLTTSAIIVLAIYHGAFIGEAIRAGINTVGRGQIEAARALGFTFPAVLGRVVLPQALRSVVQPLGSIFSAQLRNSSVAFVVGVVELTGTAEHLNTDTAQPLQVFAGAAVAYLILTLTAALVVRQTEKRLRIVQ